MDKLIRLNQIGDIALMDKKLVLVGGVFDILHFGHLKFLKAAKAQGDKLIVALESDANVKRSKGENRPIHNQQIRAEILSELNAVDYIILLPEMHTDKDYFNLVNTIKPTIIAVTANDPQLKNKRKQAEKIGGELKVVTNHIPTPSTSQLAKILEVE